MMKISVNKEVYGYMLRTFGRSTGYWIGVFFEALRTFLARVVATLVIGQAATFVAAGDFESAKLFVLYFLAAHVSGAIFGTLGNLIAYWSQNNTYNTIRLVYYQQLLGKDMTFYRNHQTGYLVASFRQHLDGLMIIARLLRTRVTPVLLSTGMPVIVLWTFNWQIGLAALGILVIQLLYIYWSSTKANKYRELTHEVYRKLTGEVADEITNIVAFRSSGLENRGKRKVVELGAQETHAYWMRRKITTLLDLPRNLITAAGITLILIIALGSAAQDAASAGLVVVVIMFAFQLTRNVGDIPELMTELDDLTSQIHPTLENLKNSHTTIIDPPQPKKMQSLKGEIRFNNVSFSYLSQSKQSQKIAVFSELDLTIKSGQQVGIVGLSGAGKSTLASLIMRFDDVDSGSITIDGTDIRDVAQSDLRRHIAYVPQEPLLFHRSIRENIAYFNDTANEKAIIRAAKAAHAHDFISKLPEGYDTIVGERGVKLSGGQKQRIVIARSILKKASIMVFDEATSALDSESEQIIQHALPKIIGKHTTLIIAHRLSTVANLDRIIVLHEGTVIEDGTHDQLLRKKGRYYQLWQRQTNGEFEEE
jgi:ATP-binding cassette subfamily B protein